MRLKFSEQKRTNMAKPDRPIYCGNFEYDATEREILRMFDKYGIVDRVDMKTGFAFVYMKDKRDAEDAIRKMDGREFGYKKRKLVCEWAKTAENDRPDRNVKPNSTLFVANFDQRRTRESDIEKHFDRYGKMLRVQIKKNYAFVQFETIAEAKRALEATDGTKILGRSVAVEYVANNDPYAPRGGSGRDRSRSRERDRSRSRTPPRRRRSPSPARSYSRSPRRSPNPPAARNMSAPRRSPSLSRSRSPLADPPRRSPPAARSRSRSRSPY